MYTYITNVYIYLFPEKRQKKNINHKPSNIPNKPSKLGQKVGLK